MSTVGSLIVVLAADSAKFDAAMGRARRQVNETEAAIKRLQREGMDRVTAGMTLATNGTQKWQQGLANIAAANRAAQVGVASTTRAVTGAVEGYRKAENAIIDLGLGMIGLDGKAGRMAEGFLLMGVGGAVTLALTAGLALIGAAVRARTDEMQALATKAAEARLRLADAFRERGEASREGLSKQLEIEQRRFLTLQSTLRGQGPGVKLMQELALSSAAIQELQARIKALDDAAARAADKIVYDWGRVRNVFMDEALGRITRQREQAFENRMREIEAMFSSAGTLKIDVPSDDEIFRDVEASANRVARTTGEATLKKIEDTVTARQLRMEAFVQETWLSAARNIQSAMADTFMSIFEGQIKSLADFGRSVVRIVQRSIAEILAAQAASGLAPIFRAAFSTVAGMAGGGGGVSGTGPNGWGGSALRAQPALVQNIVYAPTVNAIDGQSVEQFFRRNRGRLIAEVARGTQGSTAAAAAIGR